MMTRQVRHLVLSPLLLLLLLLFGTKASASSEEHARALVDWIRADKDGYVSDKIEIRRMFPDEGDDSPMGVFAIADIAEDESLLKIPRNLYLGLSDEEIKDTDLYHRKDVHMDDIMKVYFANTCRLAKKLIKEWEKDDESSTYGPFLAYLKTQSTGQIPATYSSTGKALLRTLSGRITKTVAKKTGSDAFGVTTYKKEIKYSPNYGNYSLPPWQLVDWIDEQFVLSGNCLEADDELGNHAVALAIQRGYDCEFIPVWDMFNHHNGKLNVDTNSLRSPEGLHVWASEDIKAGQELFATYNYCHDCFDVGDDWGTPGIYRDFGFVEDYPQIWPFLDHKIYYEVVEDEETGMITAEFERDEETGEIPYGLPTKEGLAYLRAELTRIAEFDIQEELKKMQQQEGGEAQELNPYEFDMITKYHQSLVIALTGGIEATLKEMHKEEDDKENEENSMGDEL